MGFSKSYFRYYELELRGDGTGLCAITFVDHYAQLLRVTTWSLDGYQLTVSLTGVDTGTEPMYMRGRASGYDLVLKVGGQDGSWSESLHLHRKDWVDAKARSTSERIERFKAKEGKK